MAAEKREKGALKAVLCAAGGLLSLAAALGVAVAFLFFEPLKPLSPAVVTPEDLVFHSRLVGRVMKQIWRGKPKQDQLIFDQASVESTLRLLDNAWEIGQLEGRWPGVTAPRYWSIVLLPEGKVSVTFPYDTGVRLLRGGVTVLRGKGTLQKGKDGVWKILLEEAKIGHVSVPVSPLNGRIAQEIALLKQTGKLKKLDAAVLRFRVDGSGKAHVTYRPAGFMQILIR